MLAMSIIATVLLGLKVIWNYIKFFANPHDGSLSLTLIFAIVTIWILYAHI